MALELKRSQNLEITLPKVDLSIYEVQTGGAERIVLAVLTSAKTTKRFTL